MGDDEEFTGSSDEPSEYSDEELDVLAQACVDSPSRRKNNKLRYELLVSFLSLNWVW